MYDVYQIMAGDTIDAIANKFGTNSSVIRQLNPNSGFGVGSMIVVPVTNQYFDIYTIKKGDSLYEIARKYNTDYNLLAMLNGISTNDYIYPDTTILVPKKDVKYYFTKDNDTLSSVNKLTVVRATLTFCSFSFKNNIFYIKRKINFFFCS